MSKYTAPFSFSLTYLAWHTRADVTDKRYLFWTVGNYVIAYRVEEELVVVRVFHGARDFRILFGSKQERP
jgi:plasmid stabilization system protein ParE